MTTKRMLIDSTHPEETRVAVIEGDRLTEYDVEIASRRQLKGNIYLAKVTRVEPSLQAAFVEYGGNRHGFLAFNEIHPDYYQIPVADREALLAAQAEAESAADARTPVLNDATDGAAEGAEPEDEDENEARNEAGDEDSKRIEGDNGGVNEGEVVGGVDEDLDVQRPRLSPRNYKIQEVIKRRQILLVQVVKEERGTKGAALTTYLSIAGRYCVLMPNTIRGGGISRKITSTTDRKRLKKILGELGIPEGMAVIVRTAGSERSKAEIRRDYEYLIRLWNNIRELVLTSMAPALVYEEGNLIKRSLRDLYDRDTGEILIEGETAYRVAKDFMKLFIPSHAKKVQLYEGGNVPLFHHYQVENELEAMHLPRVELKSGGSIVLNPTEALVAVDVNSGRSTRERHIEETALRTNLEACDEIGRQLRLRDLAGLIVIDFIDMENTRNQAQVERRLKEAMKSDRARIQLGRISTFGLLELSRQRLRPSLFETSFTLCTFCAGTGVRRTTESTALSIFRRIEQEGVNGNAGQITVKVPTAVAFYLLNNKRRAVLEMEQRFGMTIFIAGDDALIPPDFEIYPSGERAPYLPEKKAGAERPQLRDTLGAPAEPEAEAEADAVPEAEAEMALAGEIKEPEEPAKRGRRRRPRRRKRTEAEAAVEPDFEAAAEAASEADLEAGVESVSAEPLEDDEEDEDEEGEELQAGDDDQQDDEQARLAKKRRRRGKRGGRRRARRPVEEPAEADAGTGADLPEAGALMPAADLVNLADVSGAPLSNEASAFDAEDREDGEADSDGERAEAEETGHQAEMLHEAEAAHEVPDDQEPEHERVEIDAPEVHPEETPGESELASAAAAADEIEPPAHEHQEPESWEADRRDGDGQDFERPAVATSPEHHGTEDHGTGDSGAAPESTGLDRHQSGHGEPVSDDDRREQEPAPEHGGDDHGDNEHGGSRDKRSVTVNTSRTVVINVGEDDEGGAEGGRRGWWQRLLS